MEELGPEWTSVRYEVDLHSNIRESDEGLTAVESGDWVIENVGTPPDIEVELDPYLWRQGRDAQLEAAIAQIFLELKNYKPHPMKIPAYPDKSKLPPGGG